MSGEANKVLVQRIYRALNRGDVVGVLGGCDERIEWSLCTLPGREPTKGHEAVAEEQLRFEEEGFRVRFEPRAFYADGNTVVAVVRAEARSDGVTERSERVHLWTLRGGRAVRVRAYERGATRRGRPRG